MSIIINPGSEPLADSYTEDQARDNMEVFAQDARVRHGVEVITDGYCYGEEGGRYTFLILVGGYKHEIDMPGWPVEQVRWLRLPGQNIWDYPRLYVDGSSWVWHYALNMVDPAYMEEEED